MAVCNEEGKTKVRLSRHPDIKLRPVVFELVAFEMLRSATNNLCFVISSQEKAKEKPGGEMLRVVGALTLA